MSKTPIKMKSDKVAKTEAATTTTDVATYIARADGWVAGKRVKRGEEVRLTADEAKYEPVDLPPSTVGELARGSRLPNPESGVDAS